MSEPALTWKHGKTHADAKAIIQTRLAQLGYAKKVAWSDDSFSVSVGFGAVLKLKGEVDAEDVIVHSIGGAASTLALAKLREVLCETFPGGSA
jgi:hypothetical protein